jgi:hypothetical protein
MTATGSRMKRSPLEHAKRRIKKLSLEERKQLISFLGEFPDSASSYDPHKEIETLKKHGKRLTGPDGDDDYYLVNLVFVKNLVSVQILDTEVLRAVFFPENFIKAFPLSKRGAPLFAERFKANLFTDERRQALRLIGVTGIKESDAELNEVITKTCKKIGKYWMGEKAERIAEQISLHLPGMVADMFTAAIKGQTFYDFAQAAAELGPDKLPSVKDFKKIIQDVAWRDVKPHLATSRRIRTKPEWRGEETLNRYAQRVNDRKSIFCGVAGVRTVTPLSDSSSIGRA